MNQFSMFAAVVLVFSCCTASASEVSQSISLAMPDDAVSLHYTPTDDHYDLQSHLAFLQMPKTWELSMGEGVVVAVIDSGVKYDHEDLESNIWNNPDEIPNNDIDDDQNGYVDDVHGIDSYWDDTLPVDGSSGHGTHVAGIIAAADNGIGTVGIAPRAEIMPLRVLNHSGLASLRDAVEAISEALRYAADEGARVVNISLGLEGMNASLISELATAIEYAQSKGVIIVASAGNEDEFVDSYPALFEDVITVGSVDQLGVVSWFSDFGPDLDFMAPGEHILSTIPRYVEIDPIVDDPYYGYASGTSMSTPMVAGLVALLLAQDESQNYEDIYRRIRYSALDPHIYGFDQFYGHGIINPFKALSEDYYDEGELKTYFLSDGDIYHYYLSGNRQDYYDKEKRITSHYYDEDYYGLDWAGHSYGRLSKVVNEEGNTQEFLEYWEGTDHLKRSQEWVGDVLFATHEYYEDGYYIKSENRADLLSKSRGDFNSDLKITREDFYVLYDYLNDENSTPYDLLMGDFDENRSFDYYDTEIFRSILGVDGKLEEWTVADINFDRTIDLKDFSILKDNFGSTKWQGDINYDHAVGLDDFSILKQFFGVNSNQSDSEVITSSVSLDTLESFIQMKSELVVERRNLSKQGLPQSQYRTELAAIK